MKKKGKKKKKSILKKLIDKLFIIALIILFIIAIIFCIRTWINGWSIRGALMTLFNVSNREIEDLETVNIALLGISEDLDNKLTDTIILCSYKPKEAEVSLISIPRDTFIGKDSSSAIANEKINVIFHKDKEKLLNAISDIIGFKVKYYAVINNNALIKIVDIIGGIKFDVPIDMDYDDPTQDLHIHLKKGMQKIDGEEAEQLLRFRHNNDGTSYPGNYGDNDFGRMRTQRAFIEETVKQSLRLRNVINFKRIYNTMLENVETNYNIEDAKKYIPTLADFKYENIISNQLPGKSEMLNNLWFYVYDEEKTEKLVEELGI